MAINRPTILLGLAGLLLVALAIPIARMATLPLTGDWQCPQVIENGRVSVRLERVTMLPWAQPIPIMIKLGEPPDVELANQQIYLCVQIGIRVDGHDICEAKVKSCGPMKLSYNGLDLQEDRAAGGAMWQSACDQDTYYVSNKITPWRRGLGAGAITVRYKVTLGSGEEVKVSFRLPPIAPS